MSNATAPPATVAEFLLARVAEDEAAANACAEVYPSPWELSDRGWVAKVRGDAPVFRVVAELEQHPEIDGWLGDRLDHVARHDPDRVLAECKAKRAIIGWHSDNPHECEGPQGCEYIASNDSRPCSTMLALTLPHAEHPDYRQEWSL